MHIVKRQWQSPILKRIACKERAKFTNEFHARVTSLSRFRIHKGLFEDVRTSMYVAHSAPSLARARSAIHLVRSSEGIPGKMGPPRRFALLRMRTSLAGVLLRSRLGTDCRTGTVRPLRRQIPPPADSLPLNRLFRRGGDLTD